MSLNNRCILLALIFTSKIGIANVIDTTYGYNPMTFFHSFIANKEISKNRIKSRMEFEFIDTSNKRVLANFETIKYDRKGRVSKIIHFGNRIDDTIPYIIRYKWLSDTAIDAKIFYKKDYEKGKKVNIFEEDGHTRKGTIVVSKADSGKRYFTRVRIRLNLKLELTTISYLDWEGKVYEVLIPFKSKYENVINKIDKLDTIFQGTRIKTITHSINYPRQVINSFEKEAYSYRNESFYYYDSLGRVKEICNTGIVNDDSGFSKTIITYYDSIRIKTIQDIYFREDFLISRKDFFYNDKGFLIRETLDKDDSDSLIDDEYVYNGDTIIYNYRFKGNEFSDNEGIVFLWQYKKAKGLELEVLTYKDNKLNNFGTIFKYRKRFL